MFFLFEANKVIKSASVENAMRQVDRGNYCSRNPYQDSPQPIGKYSYLILFYCSFIRSFPYQKKAQSKNFRACESKTF